MSRGGPVIGLGISALAALSACPSPNRNVGNSNATAADDAGAKVDDEAPRAGKYQCHWRRADQDEHVPCEIRVEKGQKTFSMIVGNALLQGQTTTSDFGFQFSGTWKNQRAGGEQTVRADFLRQGPGAYASVLTLADKSLAKLDLAAE